MKRSQKVRILWIVVSVIMITGMIVFTILPFLNATGY